MNCAACGSTITQGSGKGSGNCGRLRAQKGARTNKLIVQRKLTEEIILDEDRDRISSPAKIHSFLARVEREIEKLYSDITGMDGRHRPRHMRLFSAELFDGCAYLAGWRTPRRFGIPMQLGQDDWGVKAEQHTAAPAKLSDLRRSSCSVLSNTSTTEVDHDYQQSETSGQTPPHRTTDFKVFPGENLLNIG